MIRSHSLRRRGFPSRKTGRRHPFGDRLQNASHIISLDLKANGLLTNEATWETGIGKTAAPVWDAVGQVGGQIASQGQVKSVETPMRSDSKDVGLNSGNAVGFVVAVLVQILIRGDRKGGKT